jgi:hypothetical protein
VITGAAAREAAGSKTVTGVSTEDSAIGVPYDVRLVIGVW